MNVHKHEFVPSELHPGFQLCPLCGSYSSVSYGDPKVIYNSDYWSHERGHSTLDEQVYNVDIHKEDGLTKNEFVTGLFGASRRSCLEIGCAPGILISKLNKGCQFHYVLGIEVDPKLEPDIRKAGGYTGDLMFGLFPECTAGIETGRFSSIIAMDVFEHVVNPMAFLEECSRLLDDLGQLIIIAPMTGRDPNTDIDIMPERMFDPSEHAWVHSFRHVLELASNCGGDRSRMVPTPFEHRVRWAPGHECVVFINVCKKSQS